MFKLISMKTIGTTAISLVILAGTLATPAFAKGTTGYIKPAVVSNRHYESEKSLEKRAYDITTGRRINLSEIDAFKERGFMTLGGGHVDLFFFDQERTKSVADGTSSN